MKSIHDMHVLFVDDEPDILSSLNRFLRKEPYKKSFANNARTALETLASGPVEVIVSDFRMPDMDGLALLGAVKKQYPDVIRLILSATRDVEVTINAINSGGVFRFIPKPLEPGTFKQIIHDAIEQYRMKSERKELLAELSRNNLELRDMADALRTSEQKFRAMGEAAFDAVVMMDNRGRVVFWNNAAEKMFGYTQKEVLERDLHEMIAAPEYRTEYQRGLHEFQRSGNGPIVSGLREVTGIRRDGSRIPVELTVAAVRIQDSWHAVGVVRDITGRVEAERKKKELEAMQNKLMTEIETRLLREKPPRRITGARISPLMISAGHLDGDFADFVVYDDKHVDILIGDVMGKGVQSALVGAAVKSFFLKALAQRPVWSKPITSSTPFSHEFDKVSTVVSDVHGMCIQDLLKLNVFVTLCYARLDLALGQMAIVDCGHTATIHFRSDSGDCVFLKGENPALGIVEEQTYKLLPVPLKPGDVLLFYSDGVTEAESVDGEQFGESRLAELVRSCQHFSGEQMAERIRENVAAFSGSDRFNDDFTCIAVNIEAGVGEQPVPENAR